jgi:hypothetical protein
MSGDKPPLRRRSVGGAPIAGKTRIESERRVQLVASTRLRLASEVPRHQAHRIPMDSLACVLR